MPLFLYIVVRNFCLVQYDNTDVFLTGKKKKKSKFSNTVNINKFLAHMVKNITETLWHETQVCSLPPYQKVKPYI